MKDKNDVRIVKNHINSFKKDLQEFKNAVLDKEKVQKNKNIFENQKELLLKEHYFELLEAGILPRNQMQDDINQ